MMIANRQSWIRLSCCLLVAAGVASALAAAVPNYLPTPTVIEYVVDPNWPRRPVDLGRRAAVPGVAIDKHGRIWCVERSQVPVQIYSTDGELVSSWGQGQFKGSSRAYTASASMAMAMFGSPISRLMQGKFVKAWGSYDSGKGQFVLPHMIVVDSRGILYVAGRNAGRIQLFDQEGKFLDQWINLIMPWGLWISSQDELWVCGSSPQWWRRNGDYPPPKDQLITRMDLIDVKFNLNNGVLSRDSM